MHYRSLLVSVMHFKGRAFFCRISSTKKQHTLDFQHHRSDEWNRRLSFSKPHFSLLELESTMNKCKMRECLRIVSKCSIDCKIYLFREEDQLSCTSKPAFKDRTGLRKTTLQSQVVHQPESTH